MSDSRSNNANDSLPNNSDLDDWTLISPPHSSQSGSSSPERIPNASELSLDEPLPDDGLLEIDLNDEEGDRRRFEPEKDPSVDDQVNDIAESDDEISQEAKSNSSDQFSMSGFQAVADSSEVDDSDIDDYEDDDDDDDDDDSDESIGSSCSNDSSLTGSELEDYIELRARSSSNEISMNVLTEEETKRRKQIQHEIKVNKKLSLIKNRLDDLNLAATTSHKKTLFSDQVSSMNPMYNAYAILNQKELMQAREFSAKKMIYVHFVVWGIFCAIYVLLKAPNFILNEFNREVADKATNNGPNDDLLNFLKMSKIKNIVGHIPASHEQDITLQLLHDELSQCIKRQNPASFKYYMTTEDNTIESSNLLSKLSSSKSIKNLVCYGQETHWRKRFDDLKNEYNLDLNKSVTETRRHIINELFKYYHPSLRFDLILNQLEYLNYLENKREKKYFEDMIKHLKGENLLLLRRLNQPNETGYQKLVVNLESKNSKLIRENESLKEKLGQKAGPTFIKQALEIEKLEKENDLLKQFHIQVAQDVSRTLKQFDLHTIDASSVLDDYVSLNSQLVLTRGYLRRLKEKISSLLLENISLKDELQESQLLTTSLTLNRVSPNKSKHDRFKLEHYTNQRNLNHTDNYDYGIISDNCMRNLAKEKENNAQLELEMEILKRKCNKNEIEKCSGHHLNLTGDKSCSNPLPKPALGWFQDQDTALDRRSPSDAQSFKPIDHIVDELMLFLTKINQQVEMNQLTQINDDQKDRANHHGEAKDEFLSSLNEKLNRQSDSIKVLPNYLQETMQQRSKSLSKGIDVNKNDQVKLPPTPTTFSIYHKEDEKLNETMSSPLRMRATDDIVDEKSSSQLNTSTINNSWFFKRAKQRMQLRKTVKLSDLQNDWAIKRAKLREQLRKATSYVNDFYGTTGNSNKIPRQSESGHHYHLKHNHSNQKRQFPNRNEKRQTNFKKNAHKQQHHRQFRYYQDEL